jgi:diacylglycerol kinase (ATP)
MTGKPPHHKPAWARRGPLHVIDAAKNSLAGLRRLLDETAARLELAAAALVAILFAWFGAAPWHWLVAAMLLALVLAVEALNSALEELVDHLSPEWSRMGKNVKDLGSLAVGLILLVTAGFVAAVLFGVL